MSKELPIRKAIFWILISTVLISGSSIGALIYFRQLRSSMENDDKNNIVAIVQQGPDKNTLNSEYLAELLELSSNKPTNLYRLSIKEAKQRLLKSPLIASVDIKRVKPGTLYIDYRVRKPIAYLADYTNTAIDEEGCLIPFTPFFTPKKLPEIVIGTLDSCHWGTYLQGNEIKWALTFLQENFGINRIDLSRYHASSFGRREIVLVLETRTLRLSIENIDEQIKNYRVLNQKLQDPQNLIIDFRIPKLAFIKGEQYAIN